MALESDTFEELLQSQKDRIYSYAFYFLRDHQDAQDVTQDVFLRLWLQCKAKDRRGMVAWMMRVAHNRCIDVKRKRQRRRARHDDSEGFRLEDLPAEAATSTDPEADYGLNETQEILLSALRELPATIQSAMLMHYFQELTCREIADLQNTKESTIKVRIHRGRKILRRLLTGKPTGGVAVKRGLG
jgi:RNA polymerase sigma-70 factor (ECF subfamily)